MAFLQHKNNAVSSISTPGGINNTATSVSIQGGDTGLFPSSGNFEVTLWPANTNPTFANSEIVLVTAGQGTGTFTITRAQEGTTAKNFNQGDNIALLMTAKQLTDIESIIQGGTQGAILYFNSSGSLVQLAPGTNGQLLETQGVGQNPIWTNPSSGSSGWISDTNTWTYASAQSFTITGNVTTQYVPGTKLQWTDSGGVKYGVVISSSFSNPNTTITIITNNDFSFSNSTITGTFYSYQATPPGFPSGFNYTPTLTGFSSPPTGNARYYIVGRLVFIEYNPTVGGTSNATSLTISGPVVAAQSDNTAGFATATDNGTLSATPARISSSIGSAVLTVYKDFSVSLWTASGGKSINANIRYEF